MYLMQRSIWELLEARIPRSPIVRSPRSPWEASEVNILFAFMGSGPSVDWEQSPKHMLPFPCSAIEKVPSVCTFIIFPAWLNFL
jgi:hypothetical protein